jgi:hypothetical protein
MDGYRVNKGEELIGKAIDRLKTATSDGKGFDGSKAQSWLAALLQHIDQRPTSESDRSEGVRVLETLLGIAWWVRLPSTSREKVSCPLAAIALNVKLSPCELGST